MWFFALGNPVVDNWIARPLKDIHFISLVRVRALRHVIFYNQLFMRSDCDYMPPNVGMASVEYKKAGIFHYQAKSSDSFGVDEIQM